MSTTIRAGGGSSTDASVANLMTFFNASSAAGRHFRKKPSFRDALVQNLAGTDTMLFNRAARGRVTRVCSAVRGFITRPL